MTWPNREDPPVPFPQKEDELVAYLREQLARSEAAQETASGYHDSADAAWRMGAAAFYYAACRLGLTGSQVSWGANRLYHEVNQMPGPWRVLDLSQTLNQNHTLREQAEEAISYAEKVWAKQEELKRIAELATKADNDRMP